MSPTRRAIDHARKNHGIITFHEAQALGMAKATLNRRVADGVFVRVARGVYALPGSTTRPDFILRAADRVLGAVVSHESAAAIHGMMARRPRLNTVTVSHRRTHSLPNLKVHQSTDLVGGHVVIANGLRVTSPVRTVIDLAAVVSRTRLAQILDRSLSSNLVEVGDLESLFSSLARRGKPGVRRLRSLLEERVGGPIVTESVLEHRLFALLVDAGLPEPVSQFRADWLKSMNGRIDFAYPEHRVVIEADSRRWHSSLDAFEVDRQRDNAAQLAGWVVLRFTWKMITDEPAAVVTTVRRALTSERVR